MDACIVGSRSGGHPSLASRMKAMADQFGIPHKAGLGTIVVVVGLVLAAAARAFVPYSLDIFASSSVPRLWVSLRSCLVPTNIFIAIHIIIMVIWKLSERKEHKEERPEEAKVVDAAKPRDPDRKPEPEVRHDIPPCLPGSLGDPPESCGKASPDRSSDNESCVTAAAEEEEEDGASSGDGDSMEATWQAIMEGGASPVRRYLSKRGTWVEAGRRLERAAAAGGRKEMRKSKTFNEAPAPAPAPTDAGWRRRELMVMAHDELNLKFEEFIRKNYEQLRLQREESQQRYLDMVNRAY